ncbi:putative Ig domain-containing protein, partial [Arachidicoccus sp.]|uniref:Ig domain-containing protein n=1 Tax=Arachidicoccus sp. TaxID=1872624 RepID=UPI003D21657B
MVKNIKLSYGIALLFTLLINNITIHAQNKFHLSLNEAKFKIGDDPVWKNASYDDSNWENQKLGEIWEQQGHAGYDGYAWYRIHIIIPSSLKNKAYWKDSLRISLANVDDVDQTFLNGVEIGHTGKFPYKKNGYESQWAAGRKYTVPLQNKLIKWDKDNVIAVRVYDGGGEGGIFMGKPFIDVLERINGLKMTMNNDDIRYESAKKAKATLHLKNHFNTTISGQFTYAIYDAEIGRDIISHSNKLELNPLEKKTITLNVPQKQGIIIKTDFTENGSGLHLDENKPFPYILTRETSPRPRINGASIFGVRPGHPILYKIPATGETPLTYAIEDLPKGLNVNASNGVISGVLSDTGTYQLHLVVENKL